MARRFGLPKSPRKRRRRIKRQSRKPHVTKLLKKKTVASLRYVDLVTLDPGAGAIASHVFRANSCFDPDNTGTGHQPLLYDEYSALYSQYRVLSSKLTAVPVKDDTTNDIPSQYGVFLDKDATLTYSNGLAIIEDKRNPRSWGVTGPSANMGRTNKGMMIKTSFNAKRFLVPTSAGTSHLISANPDTGPDSAFYQIWVSHINANNPGEVNFIVTIDYIVEFSDPVVVTQS